jgi:hypothetical protein
VFYGIAWGLIRLRLYLTEGRRRSDAVVTEKSAETAQQQDINGYGNPDPIVKAV